MPIRIAQHVFIRHSQSMVMREHPAGFWPLTWAGKARCIPLADELAAYTGEPARQKWQSLKMPVFRVLP